MQKFLIVLMVNSLRLLMADDFYFPLAVGNRWEYDNGFSITIMKQFQKGDTIFYGFTSYPWPDSLPQDIWDSASTWEDFTNNFMAQVPSGFIMKDTLGGLATTMLATPIAVGQSWKTPIETITHSEPIEVEFKCIGKENVTVPAGTFANCWKVKTQFEKEDTLLGNYTIIQYIWFADGVGMVKDSLAIPERIEIRTTRLVSYQLQ
ncbi:MAG: hypothetical protein ABIL70_08555 [candidate division WOR-3 bacterium]